MLTARRAQALDYRLQYAERLAAQPGKGQVDALAERLQLVPGVGPVSDADKQAVRLYLDSLRASPAEPPEAAAATATAP